MNINLLLVIMQIYFASIDRTLGRVGISAYLITIKHQQFNPDAIPKSIEMNEC